MHPYRGMAHFIAQVRATSPRMNRPSLLVEKIVVRQADEIPFRESSSKMTQEEGNNYVPLMDGR